MCEYTSNKTVNGFFGQRWLSFIQEAHAFGNPVFNIYDVLF